jgi:hypothetical protein
MLYLDACCDRCHPGIDRGKGNPLPADAGIGERWRLDADTDAADADAGLDHRRVGDELRDQERQRGDEQDENEFPHRGLRGLGRRTHRDRPCRSRKRPRLNAA